jgi:hypothetical protein
MKLVDLKEPKVIDYVIEMGLGVSKSQGLGIYYRNNFICPTEDEYIEFASGRKLQLFASF